MTGVPVRYEMKKMENRHRRRAGFRDIFGSVTREHRREGGQYDRPAGRRHATQASVQA